MVRASAVPHVHQAVLHPQGARTAVHAFSRNARARISRAATVPASRLGTRVAAELYRMGKVAARAVQLVAHLAAVVIPTLHAARMPLGPACAAQREHCAAQQVILAPELCAAPATRSAASPHRDVRRVFCQDKLAGKCAALSLVWPTHAGPSEW